MLLPMSVRQAGFRANFVISPKRQRGYLFSPIGRFREIFLVSTAANGLGCEENSFRTPIGLHRVAQKIGDNEPVLTKFVGREAMEAVPIFYNSQAPSKQDDITTRIIWLDGLESGVNQGQGIDSFARYIYLHGTSEEGLLGQAVSHGCIRLGNKDIISVYNALFVDSTVLILDHEEE